MLGFGAIYMVTRQTSLPAPARATAARAGDGSGKSAGTGGTRPTVTRTAAIAPASTAAAAPAPAQDHSSMLLQALKEELFQLEIERQQEKISAAEYEKAKAALDQTLHRALTRKKQ
ncbi:MAG TPA: hypothetical protein VFK81_15175, partial [Terriglobales bacterium]|nr:hypothetical protein [Terriglobales bacterium]